MKITRLKEYTVDCQEITYSFLGGSESELDVDFINDFCQYKDKIYFSFGSNLASLDLRDGKMENKVPVEYPKEYIPKVPSVVFIDRLLGWLFLGYTHILIVIDLEHNYRVVKTISILRAEEIPKNETPEEGFFMNVAEIDEQTGIIGIGVGYGSFEGCSYFIKNYAQSNPIIRKSYSQRETVHALKFMKSKENVAVMGGGELHGKDTSWKMFPMFSDNEKETPKLICQSEKEKRHNEPLRAMITYYHKSNQRNERIVSASSDGVIKIWNQNGQLLEETIYGEMNCGLLYIYK